MCVPKEFRYVVNVAMASKFDPMNRNNWKAQQGMQPYKFGPMKCLVCQNNISLQLLLSSPTYKLPYPVHHTEPLHFDYSKHCMCG